MSTAEELIQKSGMAIEIVSARILNNQIKALLNDRGITQEELARRVGVSYRHMNRICLQRCAPSLLLAQKIATALGTPLEKVFTVTIGTRSVSKEPRNRRRRRSTTEDTALERRTEETVELAPSAWSAAVEAEINAVRGVSSGASSAT